MSTTQELREALEAMHAYPNREAEQTLKAAIDELSEIRRDRAAAMFSAYAFTDDTQSLEEAVAALKRLLIDARAQRDAALAQLSLLSKGGAA